MAEDWFYGEATINRTYAAPGNYTAFFASCCRISTLQNGADGNFRVETKVNVGGTNNSPVSAMPPIINLPAGQAAAQFSLSVSDPDGDALRSRLSTLAETGINNPGGLSITAGGLVTFNTVGKVIGHLYSVSFTTEDLTPAQVALSKISTDFIIRIVQQSTPPFFDYSVTPLNGTVFQIAPGQNISFTIKAQDTDPGSTVKLSAVGLPLTGSLIPALPTTANPVQTVFSWTPGAGDLGSRVINFTAEDNNLAQAATAVSINVSMKPVFNVPPTPAAGPEIVLVPGTVYSATVQASDPDVNDVVIIDQINNQPAGSSFAVPTPSGNPTSGVFAWTPAVSQWGPHNVEFRAKDSYNDTRLHTVSYLVNTTPVFTSVPVTQVFAGQFYSYLITGLDPDVAYGDDLEIVSGYVLPSWLTLADNHDGTALLSGTPAFADAGTHAVSLQLEDIYHHTNIGGMPVQNFDIEVIPCNVSLSGSVSQVLCNGGASGSIDLTVSGANVPVTYAWSNGGTAEDQISLPAGSYSVSIVDAFGCTAITDFTVTEPSALTASSTSGAIACNGGSATVHVSANGGTAPYSGEGNFTVPAGVHSFTVTDANGCSAVTTLTVTEPDLLVASSSSGAVLCNGGTANVYVSAAGGTVPYSGTGNFTVGAGTYSYIVTDANGCTSSTSITVAEPSVLTSSIAPLATSSLYTCAFGTAANIVLGYGNGPTSVTLNGSASGGTPGYSYSWSPAAGLSNANVANPVFTPSTASGCAIYSFVLTVTDANGCTSTSSASVNVANVLSASAGGNGKKVDVCHNATSQEIDIEISISAVPTHLASHGDCIGNCHDICDGISRGVHFEEAEIAEGTFDVYPNPNPGRFLIDFIPAAKEATIELTVMDISGNVIFSKTFGAAAEFHFDLALEAQDITSGMYMVRIINGEYVYNKKVNMQK